METRGFKCKGPAVWPHAEVEWTAWWNIEDYQWQDRNGSLTCCWMCGKVPWGAKP